jgi:hypothetical protein
MLVRGPIVLFTLFCLNIPLHSQSAARLNNAQGTKPLAGLEKKIKENLEAAAAESATLKIPENRAFLFFRIADLLWDFDEEGARALIEESRSALSRLVSAPDYNPSNSQSGYYHQYLRSEIVEALARRDSQLALDFMRGTKPTAPPGDAAKQAADAEAGLEQQLALKVAENDPARAMRLAEESLDKGFSYRLNQIIETVVAKDPEAAKKLAGKIFDKLKATDLTKDHSAASFAFWFLDGEFKARRQELTPGEKMYGVKRRKPALSDQSLLEWSNFAGAIALSIISGAARNNGAQSDSDNLISDAIQLLPTMEKISPAVVANIRRKYAEVSQKISESTRRLVEENDIRRNGKVEDFLALAEKSQGEARSNYLNMAVFKAVDSDADFDRARNIIDEKITDPNDRKRERAFVEWVHAQYAAGQGKIEEALASLAHLESDDERARTLGLIIETALKAGNKKNAAQLLEKALIAMPPQIETSRQFEAMSKIIRGLAETDAERAFALYESLIEPINQIASAYIRMCRFDGQRYGPATKDEMLMQKGLAATQAIHAFVEETKSLARSDFDRAMDLAGRFRQTELRVYAELNAIQAVSSKR